MNEKEYVTYEVALLLQRYCIESHKCYYKYKEDNNKICLEDIQGDSGEVDAPTLYATLNWLRIEYGININNTYHHNEHGKYYVPSIIDSEGVEYTEISKHYDEPEDALNDSIEYCIKNIVEK